MSARGRHPGWLLRTTNPSSSTTGTGGQSNSMTIRVKLRISTRREIAHFLRWSRHLFFAIGALALSYAGFVLLDARLYQAAQSRQFQQELKGLKASIGSDERLSPVSLPPDAMRADGIGVASLGTVGRGDSILGRIEISSIGLTAMIPGGHRRTHSATGAWAYSGYSATGAAGERGRRRTP